MLKNTLLILGLALAYYLLPQFLPWWSVAIPALVYGYFAQNNLIAFSQTGTVLTMVWGVLAQVQNVGNAGLLAGKMGTLFGGMSGLQLVLITAALGGLIGGLFGLTGHAFKQVIAK